MPTERAFLQTTRHYQELSPKETDKLVETMADLVVGFIKSGKCAKLGTTPGRSTPSFHSLLAPELPVKTSPDGAKPQHRSKEA